MSFPAKTLIVVVLTVAIVSAVPASASLVGNRYTSDAHRIELVRPDATWELRERLPMPRAVAAFVVGEGTAAALLMHRVLAPDEVVTDATDLARRQTAIANLIAQSVTGQADPFEFVRSEFTTTHDRIAFDLFFTNREGDRGLLENWVPGFIVRDQDDRQHIYAVRCAVTLGTFQSWASQFERMIPTLRYTASIATPTYTSRPMSVWWWIAVGAVLLVIVGWLRNRKRGVEEVRIIRSPVRTTETPEGPEPLPPVDLAEASLSPDEEVPDIIRATSGGPSANVEGDEAPSGRQNSQAVTATPEVAEITAPDLAPGYWTCGCGRKNSHADSFCLRCNADRP